MYSIGTKITASATTKPARARYCVPNDVDLWAERVASQLTRMNPPSTSSQFAPSMAGAMTSARPDVKKKYSTATNPRTAANRWL